MTPEAKVRVRFYLKGSEKPWERGTLSRGAMSLDFCL